MRAFIDLASSSLGDTLAWVPQAEEYRLTSQNYVDIRVDPRLVDLFVSTYPLLNFVGDAKGNYEASFSLGCHKPNDFTLPLIQLATECLGLPYHEIKPKISLPSNLKNNFKKKYVCIATQSTAQCKYWNNPVGWDQTVDYLQSLGYDVVCIDEHARFGTKGQWNDTPANSIRKNRFDGDDDIPLTERINDLYFCDFFIGLSSGLSWLAWSMNKPVVMISGFTPARHEFYTPYRIINQDVCNSCFSDVDCMPFDKGDWMWCPRHKGTSREFECTKQIAFEMVKKQIDRLL